jgi:hypothetical protein
LPNVDFSVTFTIHAFVKVEKHQFQILVENYTSLSAEEAQLLIGLEKEYPFSQVIHTLAARATQDNQLSESATQLHLAAMYTTDRSVLKSIITAKAIERKTSSYIPNADTEVSVEVQEVETVTAVETIELAKQEAAGEKISISTVARTSESIPLKTDTGSIYEEVIHDLERLKFLKHEFEEAVKKIDLGVQLTGESSEVVIEKKKRAADPNEELLDEIKSSKKKIKPEGPKQKEQIEIIDQFIKTQPSIKGKVVSEPKESEKTDLSLRHSLKF